MSNKISKAARQVISDERLLSKLEEFTDEEIAQLCNYSRALHTTTDSMRKSNVSWRSWKPRSSGFLILTFR